MAKILVVEDNPDNSDLILRRLKTKGFDTVLAINGQEGINASINEKPDLILMDMSLPIVNGWEATRSIKGNEDTAHIPIIALTAHAMEADRESALKAGCDEFETKPIEFQSLLQKINKYVR